MTQPMVDVVIVGAGAAGSLLAAKLAAGGKSVRVLEAGPAWSSDDLVSSQIWGRRLRWGGPFVASTGANPIAVTFNGGWGLGGSALHHYGTWPRLHVEDFKTRSQYGRGLDWPISYDDLRPYYDAIQSEVGLSGDASAEIWRPPGAPYPMPPLQRTAQADALERGFRNAGLHTAPAPMAINSVDYGGRPACLYDGWCDAGCPISALANPLALYQPQAIAKGARFDANLPVRRVIVGKSSDHVSGVDYIDSAGNRFTQPARVVILAASVVQNPALLLNSVSHHFPQGLANRHDQVGRYVMSHISVLMLGLMPEETEPHLGITGAQLICHDGYAKDGHVAPAFGSFQWLIAASIKPNDIAGIACSRPDLFGRELDEFMRSAVRHVGNMFGMAEQLPDPANRVTLSRSMTAWGTRAPIVTNRFSADETALWSQMRDQGIEVLKAAGAPQPWHSPPLTAHLAGGTIMGEDASQSVTNSYGQAHGIRNLFLAGPGLFPTIAGVNPTFTVHALALRSAEQILNKWSDFAA
jgi:choline dehydrogenase-like flavoprotein